MRDARAAHFWDPDQRFALDLKKKLAADPQHPQPKCCDTDKVPWDIILIYPPGVKWEHDLPRATYANGPVYKLEQQIRKALTP